MSDAIQYCKNCETQQMCHTERKCMKKALGSYSPSGSVRSRAIGTALKINLRQRVADSITMAEALQQRDEAREIAEELHQMGADGQAYPPLPWENEKDG